MHARSFAIPWLLALTQCGGEPPADHPHRILAPKAPAGPLPGLPAFFVAQVPSGTQGPIATSRGDRTLAVWAESTDSTWRFRSVLIQPATGKAGAPTELGAAPENLELLFLRMLDDSGAILAYTHADNNGGHRFAAMLLDDQGHARSEPVPLSVSGEALLWIDVVSTSKGPLVLWASSRGDRADVRAAALGRDGSIRTAAHDVASDLRAWQVAPSPRGAALATVRAVANKANGPVSLSWLDDTGGPIERPIALTQTDTAELDIDVAQVGDNSVVAWTDRLAGDARLYAAAVNGTGQVVTVAHPLTAPLGDQSLVKVVPAPKSARGYLFWENLLAPDSSRTLQAAPIDDKAQLGAEHAAIAFPGTSERAPEVVTSPEGLSLVTQVPSATLRQFAMPAKVDLSFDGEEPASVPVLLSLSDKLEVRGVTPILLSARPMVPSLVWGLHCNAADCFVLAALSGESRAAVLGASISQTARASRSLQAASSVKTGPAGFDAADAKLRAFLTTRADAPKRPRLAAVRVIGDSEPLSDLRVTNTDVPLVATLTYFDPTAPLTPLSAPAEDGRREPLQARIDLRGPLGESSASRGFVSLRARSTGGLAWAVEPETKDKLLAWSALDQRQAQVFVTEFNEAGKKRAQRMITHTKANVTDIAAAAGAGGFFVGWIDDQAQSSQAYFEQLTGKLERKGSEHVVSASTSGKTGLRLLATASELWAVWSDTRETSKDRADLFIRRFALTDGHALGAEQRLFETSAHSHSPMLAVSDSAVFIAWMESEPRGESPEGIATIRVARLDKEGQPGSMRTVQSKQGQPTAFGFDCTPKQCHLVVSVDTGGVGQLEAATVDLGSDAPIETVPLIRSLGPADESVYPVVSGNDVYWVDRGTAKRVRVMRAAIEW